MDKQLWVGVSVNGTAESLQRTQLSAVPMAINVADSAITTAKIADGAITWNKMGTEYVPYLRVNGAKVNTGNNSINFTGSGGMMVDYDSTSLSLNFHPDTSLINGNGEGKGVHTLVVGTSPQCQAADTWYTHLNKLNIGVGPLAGDDKYFGSCNPEDVVMQTNSVTQMTMIGAPVGTITGGLLLPASTPSGIGVIFQLQGSTDQTYIHSFGGPTNFFAGNQAGNLTMTGTGNTGGRLQNAI